MIGSNLNRTLPVHLKITSNDISSTLILIVVIVVVFCLAVIVIIIILRTYTQHRNKKIHINEIVTELEKRNLTNKLPDPSKYTSTTTFYASIM